MLENKRFSGRKHSDKSKEKMRISHLGKKPSEETKEKIGKANLGRKYSEESKEKLRQARLGNKNWLGKKHSEETKEKMRNSHLGNTYALGKKHSGESNEKNRKGRLGKKHSDESKEKMRDAHSTPEAVERSRTNIVKLIEDGKIGWGSISHKESYPEKCFREFIESLGYIKGRGFFQNYHVGSYWLDFAFVDEKRYVEIDGEQHLQDWHIEHDKKRDEWFQEQGWVGIRIPAKRLKEFLCGVLKV